MEFNEESIVNALRQFYSTHDGTVRAQLNEWLLKAQNSVAVWDFVWNILNREQAVDTLALHLFAANCLYHKLTCGQMDEYLCWYGKNGNSEEASAHLGQSLIDICVRAQSKVVRSKLASSLAAYVCYSAPDIWPESIEDLCKLWSSTNPVLLLELLSYLPRESGRMVVTDIKRRTAVRGFLRSKEEFVAETILNLLQAYYTNEEVIEAVVLCVESWVEFCNNASEWVKIVALCLQCGTTSKGATLTAVSKFFCNFIENTDIRKLETFIGQLFDFLAPQLWVVNDDEDRENIVDICIALLENQTNFVLKHLTGKESVQTLIQDILLITNSPGSFPVDDTNSGRTFNFWRCLYEEALMEQDFAARSACLKILEPIYGELSCILLRKLQHPPTSTIYKTWSAEDKELFERYRMDGGDAFACCYRILASNNFIDSIINDRFCAALEKLNGSNMVSWEETEVILYCLESIGDYVTADQPGILTFFKENLPKASFPDAVIANTALRMVSKYAHIISDDSVLLKAVWECLIGKFLMVPGTVHNATVALENLVRSGSAVFTDNELCSSIFLAACTCFHDARFQHGDQLRALYAAGYVLSGQPTEVILRHLNEFLAPRLQRLQNVIQGNGAPCTKEELLVEFDVLTCLISTLGTNTHRSGTVTDPATNPAYLIVAQSFGLFEALYAASAGDPDLVNKIVDTLKKALMILSDCAQDLLAQFCKMVILLFPPNASALSLAKMLLLLFAGDEKSTSTMVALFRELAERCNGYETEDAVESFLSLCQQLAKKQRKFLMLEDNKDSLDYSVRIACYTLSNRSIASPAIINASLFLCGLFANSDSPVAAFLVDKYGGSLTASCLERLQVELLQRCVECIADVIFALMKFNRQNCTAMKQDQNLAAAVASNPVLAAMVKEVGNQRKFREYAKQYNIECRRAAKIIM